MRLLAYTLLVGSLCLLAMIVTVDRRRDHSPLQDWLMFSTCKVDKCFLYRTQPDIGYTQKITYQTYDSEDDWYWRLLISPNRQWLYFSDIEDGDYELFRVRSNGTQRQQLTYLWGSDHFLTASSDFQWLFLRHSNIPGPTLYRIRPDGSELTPMTTPEQDGYVQFLQWLPNQSTMLISIDNQFYYQASSPNWELKPILEGWETFQFLGVSLDGHKVIVCGKDGIEQGIFAIDLATNVREVLSKTKLTDNIYPITQSSNEKQLTLYIDPNGDAQKRYVLRIDTETLTIYRLTPENSIWDSWSPDGKSGIYYTNNSSLGSPQGLYRVSAEGKNRQFLISSDKIIYRANGVEWSSNGKWLLFINSSRSLAIMHSNGSQITNLHPNLINIYDPHWSGDSQWIVFSLISLVDNVLELYRVNITTGIVEQLTNIRSGAIFIGWLNDPIDLPWHREWLLGLAGAGIILGLGSLCFGIPQFRQNGV
jgi:Tol biopolymer transport system component